MERWAVRRIEQVDLFVQEVVHEAERREGAVALQGPDQGVPGKRAVLRVGQAEHLGPRPNQWN